ncbi:MULTISPECIES: SLC13 family permease [Desulfococcus]|jgi:di/tricarboxylate transporter|uniref:Citrate transporter n=1 Tax=Desulfococcus multivorans DSM 2059 TaxID=1121405 RepID=S7UU49_DESML|nr:SLC13 family permease [Desulfococcus multivorans]AQV03080.2 SLC13 family permease [Desulfococcus multivorans]EPR35868.1 Citrate transporter [Desulfococcus multivorans DSM 2059]MDX9818646.1 SLC13 family permease [Desulfococcus multivorans]SJZ34396.1 TrkA-C domain-containing protein [Desulfococcus multivorans DSM 2059]
MEAPLEMTPDMLMVFGFLVLVTALFVFEVVRVDMVGLLMMVLLPLSGVIEPGLAVSGLSSNAVVSIIAVIIIGEGLDKTGVMNVFARQIIRLAGKSERRIMALIAGTVALISSFMQNIGAAALFLPATHRISHQLNVPISRILIPMGYCAVIGGCITLVGSSPLILLNDLMASWWANTPSALADGRAFEPFGLFSVAPIGIALVLAAILYFVVFGKIVLPAVPSHPETDGCILKNDLECTYGKEIQRAYELHVPRDFKTRRLDELRIRPLYHSTVICICKREGRYKVTVPARADIIEPGDVVGIISNQEHVERLAADTGWALCDGLDRLNEVLSPDVAGITEAVVTPRSELVGKTLHEIYFRKRYHVNPLALYRKNQVMLEDISATRIQPGDALLLQGEWEKFHILQRKPDLAFTEHIPGEILHPEKAGFAIAAVTLALVLALGFKVQLSIALLSGALCMILTGVLSLDEAYRGVDWMTVFLLAGLIPLGLAFEKTGAAFYLSTTITHAMSGALTPLVVFLVIGLLTSFFTLVTSNIGAAVLMVPLAMNMALQCDADPRMAALLVGVAASNTFILPTHQVNALIMKPGGYRVKDYVRAGAGMTLIFIAVVMSMLYFFYGIHA